MLLTFSKNLSNKSNKTDRPDENQIAVGIENIDTVAIKKEIGKIKVKVQRISGFTNRLESDMVPRR